MLLEAETLRLVLLKIVCAGTEETPLLLVLVLVADDETTVVIFEV